MKNGRLWEHAMSPSACISLASSLRLSPYLAASSTKASQTRWAGALPSCTTSKSPHPGHGVALSAGLGEKPSSQLVCCPGPLVSGFPALHNLSIRAKYICHFPLSGDHEMSRPFQNSGEKKCYVTPNRGLELSRHAGASHRPFLLP